MPGWAQAVLDAQRYAGKIEYMLTRRSLGFAREAVGELTAVVCEDSLDLHWRSPFEAAEEVSAAALGLVAVGAHEDPSGGAVDGHEEIAPMGLIGCPRRPNFDPPCRSNIDPGMDADRVTVSCG